MFFVSINSNKNRIKDLFVFEVNFVETIWHVNVKSMQHDIHEHYNFFFNISILVSLRATQLFLHTLKLITI